MQRNMPRVLIISNECLSQKGSNGRTLRNFFLGWPKEKLAQFYIRKGEPDFGVCSNYYCVTDGQALRAVFGRKIGNGTVCKPISENEKTSSAQCKTNRYGKNAITMLVREQIWVSGAWKKYGFFKWLQAYTPEVVVLQAGDCGFMYRLAVGISERLNIPLVLYNSEGYYFKDFDYFRSKGFGHLCYPLFRKNLCRQVRKAISKAYSSVYCCKALEEEYQNEFNMPSTTIYTATEIKPYATSGRNETFTASYLGNLGVGRHEPLIEIANVLHAVSEKFYLDIYANLPNAEVKRALEACPGIRYKGFVSYEEVQQIIARSDLLVHAESFTEFYREDSKFAFSTKIADTLASGKCFLLYAPAEVASARYLKENEAAYVVENLSELKDTVKRLIADEAARGKYTAAALALVARNHDAERNSKRFRAIILNSIGGQR